MLAADRSEDGDDRRALERLCVATREVRPVGELLPYPGEYLVPSAGHR